MRKFIVNDVIYHQSFDFLYDCDHKTFSKYLHKRHGKNKDWDDNNGAVGKYVRVSDKDGKEWMYLWMNKMTFKISDVGNLVHELKHLTDDVMEQVGIKEDWEPSAYYMEYIFETIMNKIKK